MINLDNSDLDGSLEFIQGYGTHYLAGLTMGGRFGFQSEFETNSYMNMLSIGLDVKVAAGYSGEIDIEASTAMDIQIQMASEFNRHRKAYKIYQVGGTPPSDASGRCLPGHKLLRMILCQFAINCKKLLIFSQDGTLRMTPILTSKEVN